MTQHFTVANFNVRNLVPVTTDRMGHYFYSIRKHNSYPDKGGGRESSYASKINWLARQLNRMDADIICFQEIFDLAPLQDVVDASHYAGKAKLYMAGEADYEDTSYKGKPVRVYHAPRVALLVRKGFEVTGLETLEDVPDDCNINQPVPDESGRVWKIELTESGESFGKFIRPVLKANIRLPKRFNKVKGSVEGELPEITVFSTHFKSKRPLQIETGSGSVLNRTADYLREAAIGRARSLLLRAVEAAALRSYIIHELKTYPGRPVLVAADLNDGPRSVTTEVAGGLTQPVFHHEVEPDEHKREKMFELSADLSLYSTYHLQTLRTHRDVYYTHIFDGHHDTLDHILVSSHFVPRWIREGRGRNNIGKVGTLRVHNDHLLNADVDDLHSQKVGKYLHTRSDHGQVVVRLDWFEKGPARKE